MLKITRNKLDNQGGRCNKRPLSWTSFFCFLALLAQFFVDLLHCRATVSFHFLEDSL
jgi:hypothetical protein